MTRRGSTRVGRDTSRGRVVSGMARGLAVTTRNLFRRSVTRQYPETKPDLPPRSRGVIALLEENCTVCMLCARECPDWCIYIDSHKEVVPATEPGAKDRTFNQLDRFAIDFSLCMYCGICIEACPFDALFWSPEFEYADTDILELLHEKDTLREWMWTVPAPSAHDEHATPGKEVAAAIKIAAGAPGAAGAATALDATGAGLTGGTREARPPRSVRPAAADPEAPA